MAILRATLKLACPEATVGSPPLPAIVRPDLTKHLDFIVAVREILGWTHIEGDFPALTPMPPHVVR